MTDRGFIDEPMDGSEMDMSFEPSCKKGTALAWVLPLIAALAIGCSSSSATKTSTPTSTDAAPSSSVTVSATASGSKPAVTSTAPTTSAQTITNGTPLASVSGTVDKIRPATVQITNERVQFDRMNQPQNVPAGVGTGVIYDK